MSAPTDTEHPPGKRRPLDAPYPFDGISPSPDSSDDFSSSGAILDFFLRSTTHHTPESLKQHAGELQKTAYDIFPYPCIRSYAFLRYESFSSLEDRSKADPYGIIVERKRQSIPYIPKCLP